MSDFKFSVGEAVEIQPGRERGKVIARSDSRNAVDGRSYEIRYVDCFGGSAQGWQKESDLLSVGAAHQR